MGYAELTATISDPRRDLELDDVFLAIGNCFGRVEIVPSSVTFRAEMLVSMAR